MVTHSLRKGILSAGLLVLCQFLLQSCSSSRSEDRVKQRFTAYMNAWRSGDFETMWSIRSSHIRNPSDKEKSREIFAGVMFHPASFAIIGVRVSGAEAIVKADLRMVEAGASAGIDREACRFTRIRGDWYLDWCKPRAGGDPAAAD